VISASGFSPAPKLGTLQCFLKDLARGAVTQGLVQSLAVIEIEVSGNAMPCFGHILVSL
jgi:hypothetical protein